MSNIRNRREKNSQEEDGKESSTFLYNKSNTNTDNDELERASKASDELDALLFDYCEIVGFIFVLLCLFLYFTWPLVPRLLQHLEYI